MQIWIALLLTVTACSDLEFESDLSCPFEAPSFPFNPKSLAEDKVLLNEIYASSHAHKGAYYILNSTLHDDEAEGHVSLFIYPTELDKCTPDCAVIQRIDNAGKLLTPQIYVNKMNQLLVLVYGYGSGQVLTFDKKIKLYTWQKITVSLFEDKTTVCVSSIFSSHCHSYLDKLFEYSSNGPWIIGGSPHRRGMPGFVKDLTLVPCTSHLSSKLKNIDHVNKKLSYFKPGLTLPLAELFYLCKAHEIGKIPVLQKLTDKSFECPNEGYQPVDVCYQYMDTIVLHSLTKRVALEAGVIQKHLQPYFNCTASNSYRWVLEKLAKGNLASLGEDRLFQLGEDVLLEEEDVCTAVVITLLTSCYGNPDRLFQLAALLSAGVVLPSKPLMAKEIALVAASQGSVLANLAMADTTRHCPLQYAYHGMVGERYMQEWRKASSEDLIAERSRLQHGELGQQDGESDQVFQFLLMQANQGNAEAQANVGRMYYWGQGGVERNIGEAFQMQQAAALQDHPDALFDTGIMLMKGHGTAQNVTKARYYLEKAAKKGNKGAYGTLGYIELHEHNNVTGAVHYFNMSHELGDTDATHNLAIIQAFYEPFDPDPYYAHKMFKLAADRGHKDSTMVAAEQTIQGLHNQSGDCGEAVRYLRMLSDSSNIVTGMMREAAVLYQDGRYSAALLKYLVLAEAGVEMAQYNVAWVCQEHLGKLEYRIAGCSALYYTKSAHLGYGPSQAFLANLLWREGEFYDAARWYARAAENHVPEGLFGLGYFSKDGIAVGVVRFNDSSLYFGPDQNLSLTRHLWYQCFQMEADEAMVGCGVPYLLLLLSLSSPSSLLVVLLPYCSVIVALSYCLARR